MDIPLSSSGPFTLRPLWLDLAGASLSEVKGLWVFLPYTSPLSLNGSRVSKYSHSLFPRSLLPTMSSTQRLSCAGEGSTAGLSPSSNIFVDESAETVCRLVLGRPAKIYTPERIPAGLGVSATSVPKCPTDVYPPGMVPTTTKGNLFVGSLKHALDENLLRKFDVKLVVTVAWPYGSWPLQQRTLYSRLGIGHINHPLLDSPSQALDFARLSLERIHSYLSKGATVLVHCEKGISRSVSLCIAYLIVYDGHTTSSALEAIRKYRPIARPNAGFLVQLRRLEDARQKVAASHQTSSAPLSRRPSSRVDWPQFHCFPIFPFPCRPECSWDGTKEERVVLLRQGKRGNVWENGERTGREWTRGVYGVNVDGSNGRE
ncbi:dsptp1 protein, related [Neospora caninum Liverpool]|uniref:Dsptp1 protein, related n=1 Tax=Neospora caninum (strain Liverpool) TaxID=572307 RepID=F0V8J5_NEOCL|nr:dsptp1 protein, related [Neospora caninum Liverpool]CBZ50036.1 dsptp1 protein, related [Neospora caninum Liverpool]CEL64626.1 TPA: DsPTP1 protein, related [Neospora caninum Liverpool]|eukprot:XP_003880071.1 dsptp1 protein, related [Neospora caninum Liverpool]